MSTAMIKQESIQQVLAAANVEDVIKDYVQLKRNGANLKGLCPFHNEKTPSFTVSPAKNLYKCFGCGQSGNAVRFIMEYEGVSFIEAIRTLAQRYNIVLEETGGDRQEYAAEKQLKDSLYIVNEFAATHYHEALLNTEEGQAVGLSYFKSRGFNQKSIDLFRLGYADKDRTSFKDKAVNQSYNIEYLKTLGLVSKKDFDFFRERVMFPIFSLSGKVVAFAGRLLRANDRAPKYLNSPESEIYAKRELLYGIYQAKNAIRKLDECIIVEGYTDVITLVQYGVEQVVASSGTSLTEGQIRLIKRFTNNIKILYDGDRAGIKAAMRGIDLVLEQDMNVQLVLLPDGEDPDSYLKSVGSNAFEQYLKSEAQDFILFKTSLLLDEAGDDPIKRTRVLKSIVESISFIPDALKRNVYIQTTAKRLDVTEQLLITEAQKLINARAKQNQLRNRYQKSSNETLKPRLGKLEKYTGERKTAITDSLLDDFYQERDLIRVLILFGDQEIDVDGDSMAIRAYILSEIEGMMDQFDYTEFKRMLDEINRQHQANLPADVHFFTGHPEKDIQSLAIDLITSPHQYAKWEEKDHYLKTQKPPEENYQRDAEDALLRFQERKMARTLKEIEARMKADGAEDDMTILLQAHMHVKKIITELQSKLGTVVPVK